MTTRTANINVSNNHQDQPKVNENHGVENSPFEKPSEAATILDILPERIVLKDYSNLLYFTPRMNGITNGNACYTAGTVSPEPGMPWACHLPV